MESHGSRPILPFPLTTVDVRTSAWHPAQPCCSVWQCVTVCCSVLQWVAVCCSMLQYVAVCYSVLQCVAMCCSVLQYVAVCCSVLQCEPRRGTQPSPDAMWCDKLQCVAGSCSGNHDTEPIPDPPQSHTTHTHPRPTTKPHKSYLAIGWLISSLL